MDEELNILKLDKPAKGKIKTKEQMDKHSIDPSLANKPIERALVLLNKGEDVQRLSVVNTLPDLVEREGYGVFQKIAPKIQQTLPTSSTEFQVLTARMFRVLLERNYNVTMMVPNALAGLDSPDPAVITAWLDALLQGIPLFPIKTVINEIMPIAVRKCTGSTSVQNKIICSRILGKICCHGNIDPYVVKKEILPAVHTLCQDCTSDVRAIICQQLPFVANGLGVDSVKQLLLPSIIELATDDNVTVRASCAGILPQMFPFLHPDSMKTIIVPIVMKFCDTAVRSDDVSSIIISREIGRYCHGLACNLNITEATVLINCYKTLSLQGTNLAPRIEGDPFQDVTRRQHCAFNLPAMTMFVLTTCPQSLDTFYSVLTSLATDSCYLVRRIVASGIHEVGRCLGSQVRMIKDDVVKLLRDDSEDVLHCFVPHITATFSLFEKQNVLQTQTVDSTVIDIGRALLKCESLIGRSFNWRLYTLLLRQMECLPDVFPSEFIHTQFLPIVFQKILKGHAKPCRQQACRTLLKFLRYNSKPQQRTDIRNRIINELCRSKCCYTRITFIRLCTELLDLFSTEYFKEFFYFHLLSLTDDKVPNIRLCLLTLFPKLKTMLRMPNDKSLLAHLEGCLLKLNQMEQDRDCRELLSSVIIQLQNIEVLSAKDKLDPEEKRLIDEERKTQHLKGGGAGAASQPNRVSIHMPISDVRRANLLPQHAPGLPRDSSSLLTPTTSSVGNLNPVRVSSAGAPRSSSVPPILRETMLLHGPNSDMSILQKHFYMDAGIQLPLNALHAENPPVKNGYLYNKTCEQHKFGFNFVKTDHIESDIIIQKLNLISANNNCSLTKKFTDSRTIVPPKIRTGTIPKIRDKPTAYSADHMHNLTCTNPNSINSGVIINEVDLGSNLRTANYSHQIEITKNKFKRRSLDASSKIPVSELLSETKINSKIQQCQKYKPVLNSSDDMKPEKYFNIYSINPKVCSKDYNRVQCCKTGDNNLKTNVVGPINKLQKMPNENRLSLSIENVRTADTGDSSDQQFPHESTNSDLQVVGSTKLRLRKSISNENKFSRNAKNRFSLPAGSNLPVPIRKK